LEPLLTHLPHLGLALVATVLFVWMERAERRARLVLADGEAGDGSRDETFGGPRGTTALGMVIGAGFGLSVLGLVLLEMIDERPGWSLVLTYLLVGLVAAIWAAWSTPRRLPVPLRQRLGGFGCGLVGGVIGIVFLWGVVFAGMLLSQGVVLPSAHT
jgi:hypothetical protein